MRKFILYFLLIMLVAATGTFSYGFWNAKKIRSFAAELNGIQKNHDFSAQMQEIESGFRDSSRKDAAQIRKQSKIFSEKLGDIISQSQSAGREIEGLTVPKTAAVVKNSALEYYAKVAMQAKDLEGIVNFMDQISQAAAVFEKMNENANLDEIKSLIVEAKEKSAGINVGVLPQELQSNSQNLKDGMNAFLAKLDEVANQRVQNTDQLDAAYEDFSRKEEDFFSGSKKYIDEMENLDIMKEKIKNDLERLVKVKFSLK